MTMSAMVALEFEQQLEMLKDWPDKSTIFDLAILAETHQRFAPEIADILIAKLASAATHAALKIPLFYLVDCIMKTVGGAYNRLFITHIVPVFQRVFDELHDLDKARLDFLLSTWEARRILPMESLDLCRRHIGTRIVNTLRVPPANQMPPPSSLLSTHHRMTPHLDNMNKRSVEPSSSLLSSSSLPRYDQLSIPSKRPRVGIDNAPTAQTNGSKRNINDPVLRMGDASSIPSASSSHHPSPSLDPEKTLMLANRLREYANTKQGTKFGYATLLVAVRLEAARARADTTAATTEQLQQLPPILNHALLPSAPVAGMRPEQVGEVPVPNIVKIPQHKFNVDELYTKKPIAALRRLYSEGTHVCKQDGLRFHSQAELGRHLDYLFKKQAAERAVDKKIEHRAWYPMYSHWIAEGHVDKGGHLGETETAAKPDDADVFVVPFDENFVRCPITRESFETFWDDEEGGLMFRNAVKALVREEVDGELFAISRETGVVGVRYSIVHKLLVMDGWVAKNKAKVLSEYEGVDKDTLIEVAGEDDEDDVFVVTGAVITGKV